MMEKLRLNRISFWGWVIIATFALSFVFLIYPLVGMLSRSFLGGEGGTLSLRNYIDFVRLPYYFNTLKHSFSVSIITTILAILVGVPMGYVTARYNIPGKPDRKSVV